jgi:hypothetical protein
MPQNQERGVEGLRAELQAALNAMDDMKMQHSAWVSAWAGEPSSRGGPLASLPFNYAADQAMSPYTASVAPWCLLPITPVPMLDCSHES